MKEQPQSPKRLYRSILLAGVLSAVGLTGNAGTWDWNEIPHMKDTWQQAFVVSGTVNDEVGSPLPGANVVIKGTSSGTTTDANGKYQIECTADAILVVTFVGYLPQEQTVRDRSSIDFQLQPDIKSLADVVVVGYGVQQKREVTGAVKQIDGSEIASQASVQTSGALMGKIAGVQVVQNSGQPGQNQGTIYIRGIGTLGNSNPLVLIDGIPGDINSVSAPDIESISVLKDAAAAAVYGSRAANGVILITTKRGEKKGVNVTYSGFTGWQKPTNQPEFVDGATFMELQNLGATNLGMAPVWTPDYIQQWKTNHASDPDNYPSTNWVDEAFSETGYQQRHSIGISGKSDHAGYLASIIYDGEDSSIPNYGFDRYSIRLNTDLVVSEKIDLNFDVNLVRSEQKNPSQDISRIITDVYRLPSVYVSKYSHGGWGPAFNLNNPIAYIHDGGIATMTSTIARTRLGVNYRPLEGLEIRAVYAPNYKVDHAKTPVKQYKITDIDGEVTQLMPGINSLTQSSSEDFTHNFNATARYQRNFSSHSLSVLGGFEYITYKNTFFSAFRDQFQLQDFEELNAGSVANQQNSGTASEWALQSMFGRMNYDFKGKYMLEANLRYDGSSRFVEEERWGLFPSFSAGWLISEEQFMEATSFVSSLKLRGSWGTLGNQQIGTYPFTTVIDLNQSFVFGGTPVTGAAQLALSNPRITWEQTRSTNVGLDVALLNDQLNFSVDWFKRETSDILLQPPVPLILGLAAPYQNSGKVTNEGWELAVDYRSTVNEDFKYQVSLNASHVRNEVIDLKGAGPFITGSSITEEGYAIGSIYGYRSNGFFSSQEDIDSHAVQAGQIAPGDIRYVDQNNDDVINADDRVVIGNPFPAFNYGMNLYGQYKRFDIRVFLQGVGGRDVFLSEYAAWPLYNGTNIRTWQAESYWTAENPDATMPRFTPGTTHSNFATSDFWVYDASYLRVRNLQVGYTLTYDAEKSMVNQMRVYLIAENLATFFTKMPEGIDPNVPNGSTYFPINKLVGLGLNVNF